MALEFRDAKILNKKTNFFQSMCNICEHFLLLLQTLIDLLHCLYHFRIAF